MLYEHFRCVVALLDLVHNAHEYLLPYFSPLILFAISSSFFNRSYYTTKKAGLK